MRGEDMVNFKARVFDAINEDIVTHCTNAGVYNKLCK